MMTTNFRIPIIVFVVLLMMSAASATSTMTSATATSEQAVFVGNCGEPPCMFKWGYGTNLYWTTPNQTVTGSFSDNQWGSPMLTGTSYNVCACDNTSCSSPMSFDVPKSTNVNQTAFGSGLLGIMRSGFNTTAIASVIMVPYYASLGNNAYAQSVVWGFFFFFVFVGYWLRGRSIMMPAILAIIVGVFIVTDAASGIAGMSGVSLPVADVFVAAGIPLLMIGFGGVFFSWWTSN
jgi:hypothetical protein